MIDGMVCAYHFGSLGTGLGLLEFKLAIEVVLE